MYFIVILREWDDLPEEMKNEKVKVYYDILRDRKFCLVLKRVFDIVVSIILLILLLPVFLIIGFAIKVDSNGPVIFCQTRVTQYSKQFQIYKFRTMVNNAEKIGAQITINSDSRVTKVCKFLRKYRLDEIPQLINILFGDMTFVGTRPEVVKYVNKYSDEMMATLLLPAGVTSEASILYKDEEMLLQNSDNVDEIYINEVLPEKMKYNLNSIKNLDFIVEIKIVIKTVTSFLEKRRASPISLIDNDKNEVRL